MRVLFLTPGKQWGQTRESIEMNIIGTVGLQMAGITLFYITILVLIYLNINSIFDNTNLVLTFYIFDKYLAFSIDTTAWPEVG